MANPNGDASDPLREPRPADERLMDAGDSAVGRYGLAVHFPTDDREKPALEYAPQELDPETDAKALFLERARQFGLAPN